jgi:tRNA-specific 2-thiouridylase
MCNREVKFGAFHRFAKEHGADAIATGHYARTEGGRLFRGIDDGKDQSYFLWAVPKEALADTVLPLGGMHKAEVRKLAEKYRLPNAAKKDSQGICFLGSISVEDFLRAELAPEEGKTLDGVGNEIGSHGGAVLYTLGERIVLEGSASGPWYVVAKDLAANTVTVAHEISSGGARHSLKLTEMNWLGSDDGESAGKVGGGVGEGVVGEEAEREVEAQYRYHGPRIKGAMRGDSFIPAEPLAEPVASGQSLVSYQGNECVGGGIIT